MSNKKKIVAFSVSALVVAGIAGTVAVVSATSGVSAAQAATVKAQVESHAAVVPVSEPDIKPYIVPGALDGLKISEIGTKKVSLVWNKTENVTGYRIYRAEEDGELSLYKTVSSEGLEDSVSPAKKYDYRIEPLRSALGIDKEGESASVSLMTKPEPVKNLRTTKKKTGSITVRWNKSVQADSYDIYRAKESSDGNFSDFKKIKNTTKARLKDEKLDCATVYKYKVEAVRSKDDVSAVSDPESVEAMTKMGKPQDLKTGKTTLNTIHLKWDKVKNADEYEIRRGKKKLATVKGTSYTDKKLKHSTVYKYKVKAVRKMGSETIEGKNAKLTASTNVKVPYVKGGLSGTWVQVNIATQTLTMYVDSKVYLKTPVVTGNVGDRATSKGFHRVISRKSPAILKGSYGSSRWTTKVNYWLGFTYSGQGIHDSTWRSSYGGKIYTYNGSHGCVNTPYSAVAKVYAKSYYGMPVIVY
ncbi:MAG: L,D-transpeptidase family protein [Ruminococcus sp.]|nr:L,D-transpeptidase family protein [Ruminococcus sp.]